MGQNLTNILLVVTQAVIFFAPNLRDPDTKLHFWRRLRNGNCPVLVRTTLAGFQLHALSLSFGGICCCYVFVYLCICICVRTALTWFQLYV